MQFDYDAFVSYRTSVLPDSAAGEVLQKVLESFPIPRSLSRNVVAPGYWRTRLKVFRDITDLNATADLGEEIREKLRRSRFLIVVCTPNTADSPYCIEEIRYFCEQHSFDQVLLLLAQGEPRDYFQTLFSGLFHSDSETSVPLAADVRGDSIEELKRNIHGKGVPRSRQAKFKVLAPVLGCSSPDELIKRDAIRFRRAFATNLSILLFFASLIYAAFLFRNRERAYASLDDRAQKLLESPLTDETAPLVAALSATSWKHSPTSDAWNAMQRVPCLHKVASITAEDKWTMQGVARTQNGPAIVSIAGGRQVVVLEDDDSARHLGPKLDAEICLVDLSSDLTRIAVSIEDGTTYVSDFEGGDLLRKLSFSTQLQFLRFSMNGRHLVTVDNRNVVQVWDVDSGVEVLTFDAVNSVSAVAISADGSFLAVARHNETGSVISIPDGKQTSTFDQALYVELAFSPDSQLLTAAEANGAATILHVEGDYPYQALHESNASAVALSADGRYLATAHDVVEQFEWTVRVTALADQQQVLLPKGNWTFSKIMFSPDGKCLAIQEEADQASGVYHNHFWSFTGPDRELSRSSLPDSYTAIGMTISRDGMRAAIPHDDCVQIVEINTGNVLSRIESTDVERVTFSHDCTLLATCSYEGVLSIWRVSSGEHVEEVSLDSQVSAFIFLSDSDDFAFVDESGAVHVYAFGEENQLARIIELDMDNYETAVNFEPHGDYLVAATAGGYDEDYAYRLSTYSLPKGETIRSHEFSVPKNYEDAWPEWNDGQLAHLTVSPGAEYIVLAFEGADDTGSLCAIRTSNGKMVYSSWYQWGTDGAAFSRDGTLLGVPGGDGVAKIISTKTWKEVARVNHSRKLYDIAFGGEVVFATAGADCSVRFWSTDWNDMHKRLCADEGRNLTISEWEQHFDGLWWRPTSESWLTPSNR